MSHKYKGRASLAPVAVPSRGELTVVDCLKTRRLKKDIENYLKNLTPAIYLQANKNLRQIIDDYFYYGMIDGLEKKIIELKIFMNRICYEIEEIFRKTYEDEFIASVFFYDAADKRLYSGASPSAAPGWNESIEQLEFILGPDAASCGSALFSKKPVIVSDTYTDNKFANFRNLVMEYGIKSSWSVPFFYQEKPIGTFVLLSKEIRHPSSRAMKLVINKAKELEEKLVEVQDELSRVRHRIYKVEWISDLDKKIDMAISDHEIAEIEGMHQESLFHPSDRSAVFCQWNETVHKRENTTLTLRMKNMFQKKIFPAEWIPAELTLYPIIDDDDELIAIRSVVLLNSPACKEYEQTQLTLQKYFKFHALTDASGFVIKEVGSHIRDVLGIEPTSWMGVKKYVDIHPDDFDRAYAALYKARDEKKETISVHRFIHSNGSVITLEVHFIPLLDPLGKVLNIHVDLYQNTPRCKKFDKANEYTIKKNKKTNWS